MRRRCQPTGRTRTPGSSRGARAARSRSRTRPPSARCPTGPTHPRRSTSARTPLRRAESRGVSGRAPRLLPTTLIVLASVATLLAVMVGYAGRAAVDSEQFANRATEALRDESVRSLIAEQITDQLVLSQQSDLLAARPVIQSVAESVVGGAAFTGTFRAGVRDVHRAVFNGDRDTLTRSEERRVGKECR